ncbi:MAG: cell division protein ZapA [Bacteroidota bacterium]
MSSASIKVNIAGRSYPVKIKPDEEGSVRKAAKLINDKIKELQENYAVTDKQDLLAMSALQISTQLVTADYHNTMEATGVADRIHEIEKFVSDFLKKEKARS